jgi:hypothetical protein
VNRIADEGIKTLCESAMLNQQCNLTQLHLRCMISRFCDSVFSFLVNKITDAGIASVAKLLSSSVPLEYLNLACMVLLEIPVVSNVECTLIL